MTSKRKKKLEGEVGTFVKQYRRKAYPGHDPNDRRYDRSVEAKIKHMSAEELDELLNGGGNEED